MGDDRGFSKFMVPGVCALATIYFGVNVTLGLMQETANSQVQNNSTSVELQENTSNLEQLASNTTSATCSDVCGCPDKAYNTTLEQYLAQPIRDTLGAEHFDYFILNESNFDTYLNGAPKPAVVLLHSGTDDNATKGLAALARGIYDEFKPHALDVSLSDGLFIYLREVSDIHKEPQELQKMGKPPAIGLYSREASGELQYMRTIQEPPRNITDLKAAIDKYSSYINKKILE